MTEPHISETEWTHDDGREFTIRFTIEDGTLKGLEVTREPELKLTDLRHIPWRDLLQEHTTKAVDIALEIPDGTSWEDSTGRTWESHGDGLQLHLTSKSGQTHQPETVLKAMVVARIIQAVHAAGGTKWRDRAANELFLTKERVDQLRRIAIDLSLLEEKETE